LPDLTKKIRNCLDIIKTFRNYVIFYPLIDYMQRIDMVTQLVSIDY